MTSPAVDDGLREEDTNNRPELAPIQPDPGASSSGDHNDHVNLSPKAAELHLDSNARWREAATHAEGKIGQRAALEGHNDAKSRWKRAIFLANILANGRGVVTSGTKYDVDDPASKQAKILETQHWLELIDSKHRYGSNLKFYHRAWMEADTKENFFQWLDFGTAKDLSLPKCSREQLERERIIYLSVEQRLNYLTKIDPQGQLRWARNNELVDTTPNKWKDAGEGRGIIPTDGTEDDRHDMSTHRRTSFDSLNGFSDSKSSEDGDNAAVIAAGSKMSGFARKHFTASGIAGKAIRRTIRKNQWIYVCDVHYNIFLGIKQTGVFQHSSFFGGSVSSAGLIAVDAGVVTTLSPLSGHYRTTIPYFEAFVKALDERGLDLHRVHVSKEEAVLWGTQHWGKFSKSKGRFVETKKEKVANGLRSAAQMLSPKKAKAKV